MASPHPPRRVLAPLGVLLGVLTLAVVVPATPAAAQIADSLEFQDQPVDTEAGAAIPEVTVDATFGPGLRDLSFEGEVTIAIGNNPGGGTLSGTLTVNANNGRAHFDDLSIDRAGSGYTLVASASGLPDATSDPFAITPGPASGTTSQITADPPSIPADGASTSTITVELRDEFGNALTQGGDAVQLSTTAGTLSSVSDQGNGTYMATLTASTAAGNATVSGTVNGDPIADTATVEFTPVASGATSQISASPTSIPADGSSTSTITVQLRDASGNPLTEGGDDVDLSTTAGTLSSVVDQGNGTYTATLTSSSTVETATITGTVNGAAIADNATVQFTQLATATAVVFGQQPTSEQAGAPISPPVTVRAVTSSGATVTSFTGNVTIAIGTNPSGGTLSGTTTVAAVAGVATFSNLRIDRTGSGYTLVASATGLTGATSAAFAITPGPASAANSTITASPTSVPADGSSSSTITVELRDALGNRLTSGGAVVTLSTTAGSLSPVSDIGDGTYTAELTAPSVATSATVTGTVNATTISDNAVVTFTFVPPTTFRLEFGQQPTNTQAGSPISPAVTVRAVDNTGALQTSFTGQVTIGIGANPSNGTLSGTTTATAVGGVATFSNLSIDRVGVGYRLSAGASGFTGVTSAPFAITVGPASGATTTITALPTALPADGVSTSTITVEVRDAFGNRRTAGGDQVTLSTTAGTIGPVTDLANGTYTAVLTAPSSAATATITGTVAGTAIVDNAIVVFGSVTPTPVALAFGQQPGTTQVGAAISPAVTVRAVDSGGSTVPSFTGVVTIALGANPGGGTLSGTTTATAVAGVATFTNLRISQPGAGYTLTASASGLTGATSAAFTVTAAPVTADLSVTASVDDASPAVGDTVRYTIRVTNTASQRVTGVEVTYELDDRLSFVSSVPSVGSYNPQTEIWSVGILEPGAGATLEIAARVVR